MWKSTSRVPRPARSILELASGDALATMLHMHAMSDTDTHSRARRASLVVPMNLLRTEDLDVDEWATTVLMGAAVLPLGVLMRFLPPSVEGDRNFAGYKPR